MLHGSSVGRRGVGTIGYIYLTLILVLFIILDIKMISLHWLKFGFLQVKISVLYWIQSFPPSLLCRLNEKLWKIWSGGVETRSTLFFPMPIPLVWGEEEDEGELNMLFPEYLWLDRGNLWPSKWPQLCPGLSAQQFSWICAKPGSSFSSPPADHLMKHLTSMSLSLPKQCPPSNKTTVPKFRAWTEWYTLNISTTRSLTE